MDISLAANNKTFWSKAFAFVVVLSFLGAAGAGTERPISQPRMSADVAPGVILIGVSGAQGYWEYEVHPADGQVRIVKEEHAKYPDRLKIPRTF